MSNLGQLRASSVFIVCSEEIRSTKELLHKCVGSDFINRGSLRVADIGLHI